MNLADWQAALSPFHEHNQVSAFEEFDVIAGGETKTRISVAKPWGDPTVRLILPDSQEESDKIIAALNQLVLPPRFTGVWHRDTALLEIIWTAQKLSPSQQELSDREFKFYQNGFELTCRFGPSTDRLVTLGKYGFPQRVGNVGTNFRNLQSFNQFANLTAEGRDSYGLDTPRSFFIEGMPQQFNEDTAIEIVSNVNFFLRYYDAQSPTIVIHADLPEGQQALTPVRYRETNFPAVIRANDLDENLLSFWAAAGQGNEILRFMLYWRIIEYAAFHHMNVKTRSAIRRALSDPALGSDLEAGTNRIIGLITSSDLDDVPRFNGLLQAAVSPEVLWPELDANRKAFSETVETDGGFCIPAIIGEKESLQTFSTGGIVKVGNALRKVRNCLSHGKDQGSEGVILPTTRNLRALRPWVFLIARAAGEVVLYKDIP